MTRHFDSLCVCAALFLTVSGRAFADGDEDLGAPSIAIAQGSGVVTAGVGLTDSQPGEIDFTVPAGASVEQVILYWSGRGDASLAGSATVNGVAVVGAQIGTNALTGRNDSVGFRADITSLGLVTPGNNTLAVGDITFGQRTNGVAVLVVIDDGSGVAEIEVRDGLDFAFISSSGAAGEILPQTFTISPSSVERTVELLMFLGDGTPDRPDELEVTVGGSTTVLCNEARGRDLPESDVIVLPVNVPAGDAEITLQFFSRDCAGGVPSGIPDSISWVFAGVVVPAQVPPPGRIGDTVFCDRDNDGVQDPEDPGIAGVAVDLVCAGPDGLIGTADDLLGSTTTDADGKYLFESLPAGLCEVTVDVSTGPADKVPGDSCPTSVTVDLVAGESFLDADFCFKFVPGEIGDTVFCDQDDDGVQDVGEPGMPDVTVTLTCTLADGSILVESQVTDANGEYLFVDVPAPSECLVEVDSDSPGVGDKVPGQCPLSFDVSLHPGGSFLDADFCFIFVEPPAGGEGCTPGFWKNHIEAWPLDPNTLFGAVFEDAFPGLTLFDVVSLKGGGLNRLGAHTVAAYLNSLAVDYDLTDAEIVDLFNGVFPGNRSDYNALKDQFVSLNERNCPLGRVQKNGALALPLVGGALTPVFRRGDADASGEIDIADAVLTLGWFFLGSNDGPPCADAADTNDDGQVDISDAIGVIHLLSRGNFPVPFPGAKDCGPDETEDGLRDCRYVAEHCTPSSN